MKVRARFLVGLVTFILVLGVPTASLAAQAGGADNPTEFDVSQLKGLKAAVSRDYSAANMIGLVAGGANAKGYVIVSATVAKFDSKGHAQDALKTVADAYLKSGQQGQFTLTEAKIDKIGDKDLAYTATMQLESLTGHLAVVLVAKGDYIEATTGVAVGEDPLPQLKSLAKAMTKRKEGGSVSTDSKGLHAGGLWNMMPGQKDLPDGVTNTTDHQLYPADKS